MDSSLNNKIYIVFSKTGTWLSRSIGVVTNSDYTHVSLSFDPTFTTMYSFGRLNPNNPFVGGLTIENLHAGVFQKSDYCQCMIYEIPVTNTQFIAIQDEVNRYFELNNNIKFKYNFIGLFAVLVNKPLKRENHFFCSEFVTTLLNTSGIWTSPKLLELTRPTDLVEIENKNILYKGLVKEFPLANLKYSNITVNS